MQKNRSVYFVIQATACIVVVFLVKDRRVDVIVNQVVQRQREWSQCQLLFKVDDDHHALARIVGFEVRQVSTPLAMPYVIRKALYFKSFYTTSTPI